MEIEIRQERAEDALAIAAVHTAAFEGATEARLVDALRGNHALTLSLVAAEANVIVGHVAFSPVSIAAPAGMVWGVGLGPIAVLPSYQRRGVGSQLVTVGLAKLRELRVQFCVVLGHANYYPRFGFIRASSHGVRWELSVPDEVFHIHALSPGALDGVSGVAKYRPEFLDPAITGARRA